MIEKDLSSSIIPSFVIPHEPQIIVQDNTLSRIILDDKKFSIMVAAYGDAYCSSKQIWIPYRYNSETNCKWQAIGNLAYWQ